MEERPYLRGMFLVLLVVIAVGAVLIAGGLLTPQSDQSRELRDLAESIRSSR